MGARRRAVNLGIQPLDGSTFPSAKEADQMSPPTEPAAAHEDSPASGDVRTARLLVAGQFALIGIIVVLPSGDDWPVPTALIVACSAATVLGLAVMVIGATGLGRGLTATPLPNAHAQLRTGGLYRYARHPIYSGLLLMMASITVAAGSGPRAPHPRSAGPAPERESTMGGNTPRPAIRGVRRLRRPHSTIRALVVAEVTVRASAGLDLRTRGQRVWSWDSLQ